MDPPDGQSWGTGLTEFCEAPRYASWRFREDMELSANNCCVLKAVFLVFQGFFLQKLQQLFSDSSYSYTGRRHP